MENDSLKSKLKKVKILYNIACILAAVAGFLLVGTAGALECEVIGLGQAFIRSIVLVAALLLCMECADCLSNYMEILHEQIRNRNEQIRQERKRIARNRAQILEFMKHNWDDCRHTNNA